MGLTLKYVRVTSAGTFHYRRRVPKEMAVSTGQTEFKRLLGKSEREALRNYPFLGGSIYPDTRTALDMG
ncbi:hypothetical protein GGI64_004522 [Rhizobium leguminosarum]|uniref:Integrase n=1 Tax=Rhizobium leguminosarum TaxID=384 RepID=A0A7Z0E271_RHILE|nr:hypothetical protein [Rhizobium leguminosarum]